MFTLGDPLAGAEFAPRRWQRFAPDFRVDGDELVAKIATGFRWAEGGVYLPASRSFVWSDIPNDRMLRWDELTGAVGVIRSPAGYANGHCLDLQGRLITCEQGPRRLTRTEHDGSITVIATSWEGQRFNSPNFPIVASDGAIWFSDPTYGIDSDYEGIAAPAEIGTRNVFRIAPDGEVRSVGADFDQPNGLAFSPDESVLYVADSGHSTNHVREFRVTSDGGLEGGEVLVRSEQGQLDGLRVDERGRIWAAAGSGVNCYDDRGQLLGRLELSEPVAGLTFGGLKRNLLFVCATTSVYLLMLNTRGATRPSPAPW